MVTLLLGALALLPALAQQQDAAGLKDLQSDTAKFHRQGARAIPNHYIVVLDEDVSLPDKFGAAPDALAIEQRADDVMRLVGAVPTYVYTSAIHGFAAQMTEEEALKLSQDDRVAFVEEDSVVEAIATQNNPPWGLDRIDQRHRPLNATYTYTSTGAGVNAYIIDTGIRRTHTQFAGRMGAQFFDAVGGQTMANDCNGHGTHVAGTVGGSTYGVAKGVRLFAVRVLSCSGSGSNSGVIAGVNWVTNNHVDPAVANMSLGGGASTALDTAVRNSIAAGVTYAVAAGNSNQNAANSSPARVDPGHHRRGLDERRCAFVVLQLRERGRYLRTRIGDPVRLEDERHRHGQPERDLDGDRRTWPAWPRDTCRATRERPPATVRNALVADASLNQLSGSPDGHRQPSAVPVSRAVTLQNAGGRGHGVVGGPLRSLSSGRSRKPGRSS